MKGLRFLLVVGFIALGLNAHAVKLEIVKKSSVIEHDTIDKAELDSIQAESGVSTELINEQVNEDGFDTIRVKVPSDRKSASKATYTKANNKHEKDDFESAPVLIKQHLDSNTESLTTDEAVNEIDSNISNEFDDEIGQEELADDEDIFSASI